MVKRLKEENIWNIPNTLSIIRIIIALVLIYLVFAQIEIIPIVVLFAIGMLTDFFDGHFARRFKQKTEFGRKIDIIADRILLVGVMLAIILEFSIRGILAPADLLNIALIMSREIISLPFAILLLISGREIPHSRFIGKLTTFVQGIAVPIVLLSIFFDVGFSTYLAVITGIIGAVSAGYFIKDTLSEEVKR